MFDVMYKKRHLASIFIMLCLLLSGCAQSAPQERELFAMDTVMTLSAWGENAGGALDEAQSEIARLDKLFSAVNSGGEVYSLNENGGGVMSTEVSGLINRALEICRETDGAFDITLLPVSRAWGFYSDEKRVPSEAELLSLLALTGYEKLSLSGDEISFGAEGMAIDLGGIAKGFASGRVIDILRSNGVSSAVISLGGNVQVLGTKPDGSLWKVAVQDPFDPEGYVGILSCADTAVVTSGGYQRYFEENGVTYHHILDPKTGKPADSGLSSVTIVSPDPTLADGLSTALFVMGLERAAEFWRENSSSFDAVFVTDSGEIYVTEGISPDFSSTLGWEVLEP